MQDSQHRAVAIVGVSAILPDAPDALTFWRNVSGGRYSISEVTPDRWDPAAYFSDDPKATEQSYSKIGGWVRAFDWDPLAWKLPLPPRVQSAMDDGQKWAVACARAALFDYGWPQKKIDGERTAVILGSAMGGERGLLTTLKTQYPEFRAALEAGRSFLDLPAALRAQIDADTKAAFAARLPAITEDSMPGELSNCLAGRICSLFDFKGPSFTTDAACASAMAALSAAVRGLCDGDYDVALSGGIDRNMGINAFVKFCRIGALSATGTRPYADGADGFVMGEGAALFVLKRLADAERDGDRVYAVIRGVGASSDGRGKGLTAPNPVGQKLAVQRAWAAAGLSPASAGLVEGHGTSTKVGDAVEVEALSETFAGAPVGSIALGSVKSNIGHLKAAAGAAGLLKAMLALHHKQLPPSINCGRPNPAIDFDRSVLRVNRELRPWEARTDGVPRRAGVSAFGFGGTNFHVVLEEHVPGALQDRRGFSAGGLAAPAGLKVPLRGALVLGAASKAQLEARLNEVAREAAAGRAPAPRAPLLAELRAAERIAIDYGDAEELAGKCAAALKALARDDAASWKLARQKGIFRGRGPAAKVAFLYPGQGSQYVGMLEGLRDAEPIVARAFAEADQAMQRFLERPLSSYIFADPKDPGSEEALRQTAITQPAVLTADTALTRLLEAYGVRPALVMGHSLGEYGALTAAGALPFGDALEAVSARGAEMTRVSMADNGLMSAIGAPLEQIEQTLASVEGYAVVANVNSRSQAVIGGATRAVEAAEVKFKAAGAHVVRLPVSHAFHTSIVAPATEPLRRVLTRLRLSAPKVPVVANATGAFYPQGEGAREEMLDLLAQQVAAPVQFVRGLELLHAQGARVFVEVGPKKVLGGFVEDVLDGPDVVTLFTNRPRRDDLTSFNHALCGLYAAGVGAATEAVAAAAPAPAASDFTHSLATHSLTPHPLTSGALNSAAANAGYEKLGRIFADAMERAAGVSGGTRADAATPPECVVITGAGLGLPGGERVFDDRNVASILAGEQRIDTIPARLRKAMLGKRITRLVKGEDGSGAFAAIENLDDVIKLAGRAATLDLATEFGVAPERLAALDVATQLAIGAGLEALRDAGIPLVLRYKTTTRGTQLPDRWVLPASLRDDTGIIFASAFPGYNAFAQELEHHQRDLARREQLELLNSLARYSNSGGTSPLATEISRRAAELELQLAREPYAFDRRFLFRALSMGHSQLAELIGARGPNTQLNSACASTTQAVSVAEDWIRAGRCRRVLVVAGDDATSDQMMEWVGAGFLAAGAAATDAVVADAATPFDRRRHGMIVGMGAAALMIESAAAAGERGLRPICEVIASVTANSAFHGSRLDVQHISSVMERLVAQAEQRGLRRSELARQLVFLSHETYTPARGGSASAEVKALRDVFGADADRILVANTKGFTGHAMAVGIEDVVAVKALETGVVPPIPNFKEADPDLGVLNFSKGGSFPIEYALRLAAGFGSQISMTLVRRVAPPDGSRRSPEALGYDWRVSDRPVFQGWLQQISGQAAPRLEIVQRTLRVKDVGAQVPPPETRPPPPAPAKSATASPARAPSSPSASVSAPVAVAVPAPALAPGSAREAAPTSTAAAQTGDSITEGVLKIIGDKTGYARDMLALDLDLEADLGVDTVKQAETFAAVRAQWNIPREETLKLRDFPTLAHVIQFVRDRRPDLVAAMAATAAPAAVSAPAPAPGSSLASDSGPLSSSTAAPEGADPITDGVLKIIGDKTGYARDMLALDLDLEADLGVDTVKQAETFAAVRTQWNIPREETLKLRDFPTLQHVIQFVRDRRPDLVAAMAATAAPAAVPAPAHAHAPAPGSLLASAAGSAIADSGAANLSVTHSPVTHSNDGSGSVRGSVSGNGKASLLTAAQLTETLAAADAVPRRVPVPVLRPALALCKETGVSLESGARVLLMPDLGGVAAALTARLAARGVEVVALDPAASPEACAAQASAAGDVRGLFWLPALDDEGDLESLTLAQWRDANRLRVKLFAATARALHARLGAGHFAIAATRLGGLHGYGKGGATAPAGGAVAGFAKALARERDAALVKAVDFETGASPGSVATALVEELLRDPGAVEIGHSGGERFTLALREAPAADGGAGMKLGPESVFVVTGAAGSIVSAIVSDLARASGGTFHLLDLIAEPDAANPDLQRLASDRDGLKHDLFERMKARGERATPALVERELAALERCKSALAAIAAVRAAGGKAVWHSGDLRDPAVAARAIESVRATGNRIDVLLHAAGLEVSHLLTDKSQAEFDLVFDVKCDGWFNLMKAAAGLPIGATVAFSSIAGRFGNGGQTDYSAANDLLCKHASALRRTRPDTRGIAIDWTAWGGIGMAARGSIPAMMERAGIEMLTPEAGIPTIRRELTAGATRGELVVAGKLGVMLAGRDAQGGLDPGSVDTSACGPMIGKVLRLTPEEGLVIETRLDPARQPFLSDHQIDGTPVLPGAMGLEAFAEAALLLAPGRTVLDIEEVSFLAPFKFYRSEPRTLRLVAQPFAAGDELWVECRLTGERTLPGQGTQETTHFSARVRLGRSQPAPQPEQGQQCEGRGISAADIYSVYFHGPAYQVLERAWVTDDGAVGLQPVALPLDTQPSAQPLSFSPRLVELCFQTAGLREMRASGRMGLPGHIERVQALGDPGSAAGRLTAVVHDRGGGLFDAHVVDEAGTAFVRLQGYSTSQSPQALPSAVLQRLAEERPGRRR